MPHECQPAAVNLQPAGACTLTKFLLSDGSRWLRISINTNSPNAWALGSPTRSLRHHGPVLFGFTHAGLSCVSPPTPLHALYKSHPRMSSRRRMRVETMGKGTSYLSSVSAETLRHCCPTCLGSPRESGRTSSGSYAASEDEGLRKSSGSTHILAMTTSRHFSGKFAVPPLHS